MCDKVIYYITFWANHLIYSARASATQYIRHISIVNDFWLDKSQVDYTIFRSNPQHEPGGGGGILWIRLHQNLLKSMFNHNIGHEKDAVQK